MITKAVQCTSLAQEKGIIRFPPGGDTAVSRTLKLRYEFYLMRRSGPSKAGCDRAVRKAQESHQNTVLWYMEKVDRTEAMRCLERLWRLGRGQKFFTLCAWVLRTAYFGKPSLIFTFLSARAVANAQASHQNAVLWSMEKVYRIEAMPSFGPPQRAQQKIKTI